MRHVRVASILSSQTQNNLGKSSIVIAIQN